MECTHVFVPFYFNLIHCDVVITNFITLQLHFGNFNSRGLFSGNKKWENGELIKWHKKIYRSPQALRYDPDKTSLKWILDQISTSTIGTLRTCLKLAWSLLEAADLLGTIKEEDIWDICKKEVKVTLKEVRVTLEKAMCRSTMLQLVLKNV